MKKVLCFALALVLAIAPVAVFADEYDNGENGYDDEYAYNAYDEDYADDVDDDAEEAVAVAADPQVWTFVTGEDNEGWDVEEDDYLNTITWTAPGDIAVYVTGSVLVEDATVAVYLNDEPVEGFEFEEGYDAELHLALELAEGDELSFVTTILEDEGSAEWNIVITEVLPVVEDVVEEDEYDAEDEYYEDPATEEAPVEEASPLAAIPTRVVGTVEFIGFRVAAEAFGYEELTWYGPTRTITVVGLDVSFTINEAGGFNDDGTVYVPVAFVYDMFS